MRAIQAVSTLKASVPLSTASVRPVLLAALVLVLLVKSLRIFLALKPWCALLRKRLHRRQGRWEGHIQNVASLGSQDNIAFSTVTMAA